MVSCGWGLGAFLTFFYGYHSGCLNNSIFSIVGLCAAC